MVEGWFMMDEAELLRQLGARMPVRSDRRIIAPPVPELGESAEAHLQRPLGAHAAILARSRTTASAPATDRAPDFVRKREAFQHFHDYGVSRGLGLLGLHQAGMSLEDIFLELTTTDSATAPAVAIPEVHA